MDESERIACLETKAAVSEERFATMMTAIRENTRAVETLAASISDYPITRERVGNMWKISCGLITLLLLALAASWGLR
jgi:hypothetical protein